MTDRLLTDRDSAEGLAVSKVTIWRHAAVGILPRQIKLGHASR